MLIAGLIFGIVVCYGVPICGLIICMRRKKGAGKAFAIGMLAFVVSQLLIRVPILQVVLPQFAWFTILQMNPWAYGLFLGVTAGIFEETARWIGIRFFLKGKRDVPHGLAFGLGHGGIEAMLLVGVNFIAGLVMVLMGQGAQFPGGTRELFLAGGERLYVIAFHVGASLLVLCGVRLEKPLRYLLGAIILHTIMDAPVVILPAVFGVGQMGVWGYGAVGGVMVLVIGLWACRRIRGGEN